MQNSQCHIQRLSGVTGTSPLKKHTPPIPQRYLILINIAFSTAFPFLTVLQCTSLIILMWLSVSLSLSLMAASRTIHHWGLPPQSNLQLRKFPILFLLHSQKEGLYLDVFANRDFNRQIHSIWSLPFPFPHPSWVDLGHQTFPVLRPIFNDSFSIPSIPQCNRPDQFWYGIQIHCKSRAKLHKIHRIIYSRKWHNGPKIFSDVLESF